MVYLLCGSNAYRALKKIAEIKSAFIKKGGDTVAIVELDGVQHTYEDILERISSGNLFARKRLVIGKRIIECHPQFVEIMDTAADDLFAPTDVFVFWETDIPDNSKARVVFEKISTKIEKTAPRSLAELDQWLKKEASARGMLLAPSERAALMEAASTNSIGATEWELEADLEKMMLSRSSDARESPHHLVTRSMSLFSDNDKRVFAFADKIYSKNFTNALIEHAQSRRGGIDDMELLRIILWKLKNIFLVQRGEAGKLNSYVAHKSRNEAQMFQDQDILNAFQSGIMTDSALKWDAKNAGIHCDEYLLAIKHSAKMHLTHP